MRVAISLAFLIMALSVRESLCAFSRCTYSLVSNGSQIGTVCTESSTIVRIVTEQLRQLAAKVTPLTRDERVLLLRHVDVRMETERVSEQKLMMIREAPPVLAIQLKPVHAVLISRGAAQSERARRVRGESRSSTAFAVYGLGRGRCWEPRAVRYVWN